MDGHSEPARPARHGPDRVCLPRKRSGTSTSDRQMMNLRPALALLATACCLTAQSKRPEDLAQGKILVTPRDAPDPHFAESVILLARYTEDGAVGLMVNRRTEVPVSRVLKEIPEA